MATINFSSSDIKYVKKTFSKVVSSGATSGRGATTAEALNAAKADALNKIQNSSWSGGRSSEHDDGRIGRWRGSASLTSTTARYASSNGEWVCSLTYSGNQYGELYQTHLKFIIPNNVDASNIKSATLKITTTANSNINICVCGPNNSTIISDEDYYHFNDADVLYYGGIHYPIDKKTTINLDITNQFIKCIDNNQGVLVVTPYQRSPGTDATNYINNLTFTLTYELNTTPCQPPTSIQDNGTNFIVPGGAIKLTWSGAQAGTNNAIAGYRIYWGNSSSFVPGSGVTGYYDFNSTSTSCSFTSATGGKMPFSSEDFHRGATCYFKICTKGSVKVNDKWYSDISSTTCSIVLNNLPESPTINNVAGTSFPSKPSRIKSEGTTSVEFNVTPGNTNNIGQTGSVYYSLPGESEKHSFNGTINLTRPSTGTTISVYFFTYDGYEFSPNSSYAVPINTKPTVTINEGIGGINYSLNGYNFIFGAFQSSWVTITGYQDATQEATFKNKRWEIWINDLIDQANVSTVGNKNLIDICNINFGNSFGLKYVVEDDIGEVGISELWYPKDGNNNRINFPDAPTYSFSSGVNNSNFGTNLGIDFNSTNISSSKLTLYLNYKLQTDNNWNDSNNKIEIIKESNNTSGTVNCNSLTRNVQYNFKIKFLLSNNQFTDIEYNIIMQRAPDITPTNGTTLTITPFTPSTATFQFKCNGITNLNQLNNKNIKFKFSTNELAPSSVSYSISSNIITAEINYNIASSNWQTFISNQNQLNKIYDGKIQISVTDLCNDNFTNEFNIYYDFSNSLNASNNLSGSLQIKCNNNYISLSNNDYPLFENQILRINLSNLKSYCNETVHFILYDHADNTRNYNITTTIQLNQSNGDTTRPVYTSGTNDYIEFTIPEILNENSQNNITYFTLNVINEANQVDKKKSINIYSLEKIKLCRCNINAINFTITKIEKNDNLFKFYYTVTDFGGTGEVPCIDDYKWVGVQFYYSNDGINYNGSFTLTQITNNPIEILNNTNFGEKVYFKAEIKVINDFEPVNLMTPAGIDYHIRSYENSEEFIFYNSIPNLAYGKNFFLINTTDVSNLNGDYILVVRPIDYTVEVNNNTEIYTRNKIYFGAIGEESYMEITQNGLIIDGGTWDI